MARLRKVDVEALLVAYDTDPVGALTSAMRRVREQPDASWEQLVATLPEPERAALLAREPAALDSLAAGLNELRTLPGP